MSIFKYLYQASLYIEKLNNPPPQLIKNGKKASLYKLTTGEMYWLDRNRYIDKCIIDYGVFEKQTTQYIKKHIKKGDVVFDIGANIGYYTVMISKLIGENGKCYAFEPVAKYREILKKNIKTNKLKNVVVVPTALSDKKKKIIINIGSDSASLHWAEKSTPSDRELIQLNTLDNYIKKENIGNVDFIKIDIDGHEPFAMYGGNNFLNTHNPIILLEVSINHYKKAGVPIKKFFSFLKEKGYSIRYDFAPNRELTTFKQFLDLYGDLNYSQNIIIQRKAE